MRNDVTIEVSSSVDRGATWSARTIVAKAQPVGIPRKLAGNMRVVPLSDAAIDSARGTLYVVWPDGRFSHARYDEITITHSSDGRRWSRPRRISATGPSFLPAVAVNATGVVGVACYTFDRPASVGSGAPIDYWFRSSGAGGENFRNAARVAGPFLPEMAPGSGLGDYEGLATLGKVFHPLFVGTTHNQQFPTEVLTRPTTPSLPVTNGS